MGTAVPVSGSGAQMPHMLTDCLLGPALSVPFYFSQWLHLHELSLAVTTVDLVPRGHRVTILMNILLWLISSKSLIN